MSTLANRLPARAIFPTEPVFGLTVENYHDMIRAGILTADDRVELLEGALICKMAKNPPHVLAAEAVADALRALIGPGHFVAPEAPMTLNDSEPEPDVMVVAGRRRDYGDRHPTAAEVALVVEVADSSLRADRVTKARVYGRAGVAVYWIVNLPDRAVEVFANLRDGLSGTVYDPPVTYGPADRVPVVLAGQHVGDIAVADLLP